MSIPRVILQKPIWGSGFRGHESFGIADYRLEGDGDVEVECVYKNRFGNRVFPNVYRISRAKARTCPVQVVNNGVRLRIVPVVIMEVIS